MSILDSTTGFIIADPAHDPLAGATPSEQELLAAHDSFLVSPSGWRKVFVASGNEEDNSGEVSRADLYLTALAVMAVADHLKQDASWHDKRVLVGIDARPTGAVLAEVVMRILLASGITVRYLFIAAAPQIMADSALSGCTFFYISASHNPIGHNGFKIGKEGGVLTAAQVTPIIAFFRQLVADKESCRSARSLSASVDLKAYGQVLAAVDHEKSVSLRRYRQLLHMTTTSSADPSVMAERMRAIKANTSDHPVGIVGELNGSARCVSIDSTFLADLGVKTRFFNDTCRQVVHPIVPEGPNLEDCRMALEAAHRDDPSFRLGYVPDNDGDRGNLVYLRESDGRATILGAQDLFALVAATELTLARREQAKVAIAVNCPTSLMIDSIATRLGVKVARAEVGEANVVQLAQNLREQGWAVRLLGEGSNGGTITHPCKVRDPMNTLATLVRLLTDRALFDEVSDCCQGVTGLPMDLEHALQSLPARTITGGFSPEAAMRIKTMAHGKLKAAYEHLFEHQWQKRAAELHQLFGITGWREEQTEGIVCRIGVGPAYRSGHERGGLKIVFMNAHGDDTDFIWMRGSGTESVFRIMADAAGHDQSRHDYLLAWQRSLVQAADQMCSET